MLLAELAGTHAYCEADVGLCLVGGVDIVCWACAGGADGHRIFESNLIDRPKILKARPADLDRMTSAQPTSWHIYHSVVYI